MGVFSSTVFITVIILILYNIKVSPWVPLDLTTSGQIKWTFTNNFYIVHLRFRRFQLILTQLWIILICSWYTSFWTILFIYFVQGSFFKNYHRSQLLLSPWSREFLKIVISNNINTPVGISIYHNESIFV